MSFNIVAGVGSAVLGAAGSIAGANSARKASRDAANAQSEASAANIALAREQRAKNEALFAQYLGDENYARAVLAALEGGTGTYQRGAGVPTGGAGSYTAPTPISYPLYDTSGNFLSSDPLRANQIADLAARGVQVVDSNGRPVGGAAGAAANAPPSPGETVTITREQALAMIEGTPLARFADEDFAAREDLAEGAYTDAKALADREKDDLYGVGDSNYADSSALAGDTRADLETVARGNLDSRVGLENDSYAAWLPLSQQAENDAINLNFSRGGVTGLIGATRRGVGETTQDAAMERNLRRLQGLQAAYDPYYDDLTSGARGYWDDLRGANQQRGQTRLSATANYGDRNQRSFDTYSGAKSANYDQFAGDKLNAYGASIDYYNNLANRGYGARGNIASGGQTAANAISQENNNRATAAANASYARGQIQSQLYGNLADIGGGLAGSLFGGKSGGIQNKPSGSSSGSYSGPYINGNPY